MRIKTFNKYLLNESLGVLKIRARSGYAYNTIIATYDGLDIADFKVDIEDISDEKMNNIAYIHELELVDEYRGKGLAKEIFGQMFDWVKKKYGYNKFELDVVEDNLPAVRLYKSLGFVQHGYDEEGDLKMIREAFDAESNYELDRHIFLKNAGVMNYTINKDGSIDVVGNVSLFRENLTKIPYKFNKVVGSFYCGQSKLTSLEGCPYEITKDFVCSFNKLESLKGGPMEVGGDYNCRECGLITLQGLAAEIGGDLNCTSNQLTSLDTASNIDGNIDARYNKIHNNHEFMGHCGGEIRT